MNDETASEHRYETHEQPMYQKNDMRHLHNDAKSVLGVVLAAVLACAATNVSWDAF